jgi:hypothetical protein
LVSITVLAWFDMKREPVREVSVNIFYKEATASSAVGVDAIEVGRTVGVGVKSLSYRREEGLAGKGEMRKTKKQK